MELLRIWRKPLGREDTSVEYWLTKAARAAGCGGDEADCRECMGLDRNG